MSQVTSNAFTVQVIASGPYASMADGEVRIFNGTFYNYGGYANEPTTKILAYSGGCINSSSGMYYLFGGGHNDYWGNEVWELPVDSITQQAGVAGQWTRHYAPDTGWIANDGSPEDLARIAALDADSDHINYTGQRIASGRPICRHTYSSNIWLPNLDRMWSGGGSYYSGPSDLLWDTAAGHWGNGFADQWLYNPYAKTWEFIGVPMTIPWDGTVNPSALKSPNILSPFRIFWHPQRNQIFGVGDAQHHTVAAGVLTYSHALKTWTRADNSTLVAGTTQNGANVWLDTARDSIFMMIFDPGALTLYEYPLATMGNANNWIQRPLSGTAPSNLPTVGDNCVYSTYSGKLVMIVRDDNKLYRVDPATWQWETVATNPFPSIHQAFGMTWCPVRNVGFMAYRNNAVTSVQFAAFRA